MPQANLTREQAQLPVVRRVNTVAGPLGILIGCIFGMSPLLFRDEEKRELALAFTHADKDGDGLLSGEEVVQALRKETLAPTMDHEDLIYFTKNAEGQITLVEFTKGYKRMKEAYLQKSL